VRTREFFPSVVVRIASAAMLGILALQQADAQQAPAGSQQGGGAGPAVENNDEDFTRPENLFQLRYEHRTAPGTGSEPGTIRTVTTDMVVLRSDGKIDVAPQWTLALRGDLPFVDRNPITAGNPLGEFIDGLGDADVQAALIKTLNARWAAGAGVRIVAPTGSPDLTSGKWRALPIVGARYMLPELSEGSFFAGLVRYDVSFAGDPSTRNVSNLQIAPTLNIALPDRWFVTFYPNPDIRINYGDPITGQTGRLFLPMDLLVGRDLTQTITLSLEIGVPMIRDYPVYDFKTVTRLNVKF
jgi:hypothetical protein